METAAALSSTLLQANVTSAAAAAASSTAIFLWSTASAAAANVTAAGEDDGGAGGDIQSVFHCSMEYVECRASRWLYVALCPLMLAAGTVGNLLLMLTMTTRDMRDTAFGVFVASLAAVDSIALWSALVRHFIKAVQLYDIREAGVWACRLHRFVVYSSIDSSAWILVALAAGRLASVRRPESGARRGMRGATRARLAVPLIVAAQLAWNAPTLWTLGEQRSPEDGSLVRNCGYLNAASAHYWTHVQPYIALSLASVAPFMLMLVMNGAIVVALRRRNEGALSVYRASRLEQGANGRTLSGSSRTKSVMLLAVSFLFLVATVPTFVQTAIETTMLGDERSWAILELVDTVTTLMLYMNGATNFFLYCLSGRMFRRHCLAALVGLRDRLLRRQLHHSTDFVQHRSCNTSSCNTSVNASMGALASLPRNVLALREVGAWARMSAASSSASSCGSSPALTPRCSPVVNRSPLAGDSVDGRAS